MAMERPSLYIAYGKQIEFNGINGIFLESAYNTNFA